MEAEAENSRAPDGPAGQAPAPLTAEEPTCADEVPASSEAPCECACAMPFAEAVPIGAPKPGIPLPATVGLASASVSAPVLAYPAGPDPDADPVLDADADLDDNMMDADFSDDDSDEDMDVDCAGLCEADDGDAAEADGVGACPPKRKKRLKPKRTKTSRFIGVSFDKRNKRNPWQVQLWDPDVCKKRHLGCHPTEESAKAAYEQIQAARMRGTPLKVLADAAEATARESGPTGPKTAELLANMTSVPSPPLEAVAHHGRAAAAQDEAGEEQSSTEREAGQPPVCARPIASPDPAHTALARGYAVHEATPVRGRVDGGGDGAVDDTEATRPRMAAVVCSSPQGHAASGAFPPVCAEPLQLGAPVLVSVIPQPPSSPQPEEAERALPASAEATTVTTQGRATPERPQSASRASVLGVPVRAQPMPSVPRQQPTLPPPPPSPPPSGEAAVADGGRGGSGPPAEGDRRGTPVSGPPTPLAPRHPHAAPTPRAAGRAREDGSSSALLGQVELPPPPPQQLAVGVRDGDEEQRPPGSAARADRADRPAAGTAGVHRGSQPAQEHSAAAPAARRDGPTPGPASADGAPEGSSAADARAPSAFGGETKVASAAAAAAVVGAAASRRPTALPAHALSPVRTEGGAPAVRPSSWAWHAATDAQPQPPLVVGPDWGKAGPAGGDGRAWRRSGAPPPHLPDPQLRLERGLLRRSAEASRTYELFTGTEAAAALARARAMTGKLMRQHEVAQVSRQLSAAGGRAAHASGGGSVADHLKAALLPTRP